ncbi:WD repeat-containing protein 73-like isoform X2 [Macrosteles quadrilineatus]|uniref:WD repeat-containing protein 73-like isoform X2 n=1 Tax=Macrosteles quadrilineatus TaxID=74068 RepID=UPI0023E1C10F|nr:WD repeat-containing protein 73-like isoform X2 [Macrosteles quadrilineatus]
MEITDEDWFYDSISRYENLHMFELEQPIQQVESTGTDSICVSCSNTRRHQLLELSLPSKLLSSNNEITSNTDLKIKCGTFTEKMCYQIKSIDECKLIVSYVDVEGISLYGLPSDSDEIKKESLNIDCPLECPMIATNDSLVWLAKKRTDKMYLFDLKTEKPVQSLKLDQHISDGNDEKTVPMFLGPHVAAFGGQRTGDVFIADHRVSPGRWCFATSHLSSSKDSNYWSFASLFECSKGITNSCNNICYAKVSSDGTLMVYDTRNVEFPVYRDTKLGVKTDNATPQIRFKPGNKDCVSVGGFNGNVYVYQLEKEDPKLLFTHDGHKHVESYSSQTEVTSHLWPQLDNLVISAADNGTIQMWQFGVKDS